MTISHATNHIDVASSSLITWIWSRLSLMIRVRNEVQPAKIFNSERYNDILPNNCLKKPQCQFVLAFSLSKSNKLLNLSSCLWLFFFKFTVPFETLLYAINKGLRNKLFSIFDTKLGNHCNFMISDINSYSTLQCPMTQLSIWYNRT